MTDRPESTVVPPRSAQSLAWSVGFFSICPESVEVGSNLAEVDPTRSAPDESWGDVQGRRPKFGRHRHSAGRIGPQRCVWNVRRHGSCHPQGPVQDMEHLHGRDRRRIDQWGRGYGLEVRSGGRPEFGRTWAHKAWFLASIPPEPNFRAAAEFRGPTQAWPGCDRLIGPELGSGWQSGCSSESVFVKSQPS